MKGLAGLRVKKDLKWQKIEDRGMKMGGVGGNV